MMPLVFAENRKTLVFLIKKSRNQSLLVTLISSIDFWAGNISLPEKTNVFLFLLMLKDFPLVLLVQVLLLEFQPLQLWQFQATVESCSTCSYDCYFIRKFLWIYLVE